MKFKILTLSHGWIVTSQGVDDTMHHQKDVIAEWKAFSTFEEVLKYLRKEMKAQPKEPTP